MSFLFAAAFFAAAIAAMLRTLGVRLGGEVPAVAYRETRPGRAPWRLVVAVLLLALGTAILVLLAVRGVGNFLLRVVAS